MRRVSDTEIEKQGSFYNYTIMEKDVSEETKCPHCRRCISITFPKMAIVIICHWCNTKILVLREHKKEFMIKEEEND